MMEGISNEAASLAGHLRIPNLCWIYDNNHVTIEGHTDLTFSDDVACRFLAYGWNVVRVGDANDLDMLERAFATFKRTTDRPTLRHRRQPHRLRRAAQAGHQRRPRRAARRRTRSGWPSAPTAGPRTPQFLVPDGVREHFAAGMGKRGRALREAWEAQASTEYARAVPGAGRPAATHPAPRAARRLGRGAADVPGRREGRSPAATRRARC